MSRHRMIRSMNYSDEYDGYEDVYGHSVEDDYSVSPSDAAFMYDRNSREPARISAFLSTEKDIAEEDESDPSLNEQLGEAEQHSPSLRKHLSDIDEARLRSCLDEVRNVIGDSIPENQLVDSILRAEFDVTRALDELLSSPQKSKKDGSPKPQRFRNQHQKDKQDEDCNIISYHNRRSNVVESNMHAKGRNQSLSLNSGVVGEVLDFGHPVKSKPGIKLDSISRDSLNTSFKSKTPVKVKELATSLDMNDSVLPGVSNTFENKLISPTLSDIFKNHKKSNEFGKRADEDGPMKSSPVSSSLSSISCKTENDILFANPIMTSLDTQSDSDDEFECNSLSSLRRLRSKKNNSSKIDKYSFSSNVTPSGSSSRVCNGLQKDYESKTLSLNDLLIKHKTESVDSDISDKIPVDLNQLKPIVPSKSSTSVGPSLSDLYLKHNIDNDSDSDDNCLEPELSSSLSKLARRYRTTSQNEEYQDCKPASSLMELAVRHRHISLSEGYDDISVGSDSKLAVSCDDTVLIGSLPSKFQGLNIDDLKNGSGLLSKSLPKTVHASNNKFIGGQNDSSTMISNKQADIDLTFALCSLVDNKSSAECKPTQDISNVSIDNTDNCDSVIDETCDKSSRQIDVLKTNCYSNVFKEKEKIIKPEKDEAIKDCSPFGKIICKTFPVVNINFNIPVTVIDFNSDLKPFDFNETSPDDKILFYLKRIRPNYNNY